MKLSILCVGRMTIPFLNDGCSEFAGRLRRYLTLSINEIREHKTGRKQDIEKIIQTEGKALAEKIPKGAFVFALDQSGKHFTSEQLANLMNEHMLHGTPEWTFLVGGPYGLGEDLRQRSDIVLSLSTMTMTHQMARLFLLEQLYRSCTIIRNEPYHH